jgi:hypothetical protein
MMLTIALALALAQDAPDDLVRKLGVDDYAEREKATEALRKLGKGAADALKKGQESEDPEVRSRSKALLEELKPQAAPRRAPVRPPGPFGNGFRGSSVSVQTINGDSTYTITPGDGTPALTFRKSAAGDVKLDYADETGKARTVEAASLAAFLKDHKDLAATYGISEDGIDYAGARVSFKPRQLQAGEESVRRRLPLQLRRAQGPVAPGGRRRRREETGGVAEAGIRGRVRRPPRAAGAARRPGRARRAGRSGARTAQARRPAGDRRPAGGHAGRGEEGGGRGVAHDPPEGQAGDAPGRAAQRFLEPIHGSARVPTALKAAARNSNLQNHFTVSRCPQYGVFCA